jgi:hypothetical protein
MAEFNLVWPMLLAFVQAEPATATDVEPQHSPARECPRHIGVVVPTETVAREIAEAVIRGRMRSEDISSYQLRVRPDFEDPNNLWVAYQIDPRAQSSMRGGGGLQMTIDRCSGQVIQLSYSR